MTTETQVANRGLQRIGAGRIVDGALWTEDSKNASEIRDCYDMLRRSELRRNVWRYAIRTEVLRKMTATTKVIFYPEWDARVDYDLNDRVKRDSRTWIGVGFGINHDPALRTYDYWNTYFGSDTCDVYSATATYSTGEQVYVGDVGYISIVDENKGNAVTDIAYWLPIGIADWEQWKIYAIGKRVLYNGVTYVSLVNDNQNFAPDANPSQWAVTGSQLLRSAAFIVPTSLGLNIFRLPCGFMRTAPQAPKQGSYTPLGAPAGLPYSDFDYEGNYFRTSQGGPIPLRFCADIEDPNLMDPMFIDGLSCRLALETCETLTQSDKKLANIGGHYSKFMSEARIVNAIETGPTEPPEDSYIALRT